jgi:hypothetical protein
VSTDLLVVNGPGVVARRGSAVLWAEAIDLRRQGLLAAAVHRLGLVAAGELAAQEFATWLVGELAGPRGSTIPALAFAVPDAGQVLCVVHGWGRVMATGGAVTAAGSAHRIPSTLPIALGRADLAVIATGDSVLSLESGVVPGGAALLYTAPVAASTPDAPPAPAAQSAPPARPTPAAPPSPPAPATQPAAVNPLPSPSGFGTGTGELMVSLRPDPGTPPPAWEPLPIARPPAQPGTDGAHAEPEPPPAPTALSPRVAIVTGVRCARQHFNNPDALYCRICGISMLQKPQVQVQSERPPLGVLVCDDGSTYGLDGDYAIGSDPADEPGVVQGLAQPLVLGDANVGVAPTHVIIHLDSWEVLALNRSPGLPAAVLHRGDAQWTPLPPGQWARLSPGSHVGFAGRHVVFESNNRA